MINPAVIAVALLMGFATLCVCCLLIYTVSTVSIIEPCQEDAVLIGDGEFNGERWSKYKCGPSVDDYEVNP